MIERHHRVLRAAALVLVFVLGGLAALATEWGRARRATRWTATAAVCYPAAWRQVVHGGQPASTPLTPQTAVEEALAALHLAGRTAGFDEGTEAGRGGPARSRWMRAADGLRATIHQADGQRLQVSFHHSSASADQAVSEVNTIVGVYAARIQFAVARELFSRASGFRAADDRLNKELGAIGPEFDRLVDRAVKLAAYRSDSPKPGETQRGAPRMAGKDPPPGETKVPALPGPENEPRTTLEALRERREELLRDRTPAHPDVRHVEALIAEAEKQLEELPAPLPETTERPRRELRQPVVAASVAAAPPTAGQAAASREASQWSELFRAIQALQVRVEALSRTVQKTRQQESPDSGLLLRGEELRVHWAEQAERTGWRVHPWAWVWVAVAGGLVLAAGAAMVYAGARIDAPIESGDEEEMQRMLGLGVAGYLDAPEVATNPLRSARARWKRPCILAGMVVIVAYVVFLLQPLLIEVQY